MAVRESLALAEELRFESTLRLLFDELFPFPIDFKDVMVSLLSDVGIDVAEAERLRLSDVAKALIDEPIVAKEACGQYHQNVLSENNEANHKHCELPPVPNSPLAPIVNMLFEDKEPGREP